MSETENAGPGAGQRKRKPVVRSPLGRQIEEHWRENLPKATKELEEAGDLEWAMEESAEMHIRAMHNAMAQGMTRAEAFSVVSPMYMYPPGEDEELDG